MGIITLKGENIKLRALEPEDLDFLYILENDEAIWEVSNTQKPYSKFVLKEYLKNSHQDIYEAKQVRLVIENIVSESCIGFIDLFDFDPNHRRVGVGIVIHKAEDKNKGFAFEALQLVCNYSFSHLNLHQIYASITEDNNASISLFEKAGFTQTGINKDWIFSNGSFKNELFYQLISHVH